MKRRSQPRQKRSHGYGTDRRKTQHRGPVWCPGCLVKTSRATCRCAAIRATATPLEQPDLAWDREDEYLADLAVA